MFSAMRLHWAMVVCVVFVGTTNVQAAMTPEEVDAMMDAEMPMIMECAKEHGLDVDKLEDMMENPPEGYSCFANCFFKKIQIVDEDGMFIPEKALENFKKFIITDETMTLVEEVVKDCAKVNAMNIPEGDDQCTRAKLLTECFEEYQNIFE